MTKSNKDATKEIEDGATYKLAKGRRRGYLDIKWQEKEGKKDKEGETFSDLDIKLEN